MVLTYWRYAGGETVMSEAPVLEGHSRDAVDHRGSHVQIIASAGSGKTEVVSQRVVSLLAEGVSAREIVAFTFTERAAKELKSRIAARLEQRLGVGAVDQLSGLYVGTIHGYCFQFLQQYVPRYETYDVLDESQHVAFLCREASHLNIKSVVTSKKLFEAIDVFNKSVQVLENELLDPNSMPEPFKSVLNKYLESLDKYRLLTFGQQIVRSVSALDDSEVAKEIHKSLKYLIVDEYQDVNPAQEELIRKLVAGGAHLTVVGDDDQAIYQWRGSTVRNIISFSERYEEVKTFLLDVNRRSLPDIIGTATRFSKTIMDRLDKEMKPWRSADDGHNADQIVSWMCETEQEEAFEIARLIANLNASGLSFSDIAILARSRAAYPRILEELASLGIPVQPGGRSGLFEQPEARSVGRLICWLVDYDWRDQRGPSAAINRDILVGEFESIFSLNARQKLDFETWLDEMKVTVPATDRVADLIGEFYQLLEIFSVRDWDLNNPMVVNRLGTLARITNLFVDYELVYKRARPDNLVEGEQVGGQDRGEWYYRNLATFILNYANGEFDGFEGEEDLLIDAVDLTTVHSSKGLEWPVVFIPSLTANRFPSMYSGRSQNWLVPREMFDAPRYEGGSDDERRLFYVAMTRARDWLSISRHNKVTKAKVAASPYFPAVGQFFVSPSEIITPTLKGLKPQETDLAISYSDLASFMECGLAFRLRQRLGFKPQLAPAIGYGKSIHHVMRVIANFTQATGSVPDSNFLNEILDHEFFLPNANKVAHRQLKDAARKLVGKYITEYGSDLHRVWQTEYPFELHLPGITVSGRADVIIDQGTSGETSLTLIDYKTRTSEEAEHDIQLQVYASAGRREGLVIEDAFVHDMIASDRIPVDVHQIAVSQAELIVIEMADKIKRREFDASPEKSKCGRCDVRTICSKSAVRKSK
jgi:DNA helicase-2/ATP-dependent DNA helicase PcrA